MAKKTIGRDEIVDRALEMADSKSWESLRLHQLAQQLDISLEALSQHFQDKDAIAEAWFDRADAKMLAQAATAAFRKAPARERFGRLIMSWLNTLAPHRRVTREIIYGKFAPGQLPFQLTGLTRVHRTVQWMREAAQRDATLPWRTLEEAALAGIYLVTFCYWMRDDSEGTARTAEFLDRKLSCAQRLREWMPSILRHQWERSASAHGV